MNVLNALLEMSCQIISWMHRLKIQTHRYISWSDSISDTTFTIFYLHLIKIISILDSPLRHKYLLIDLTSFLLHLPSSLFSPSSYHHVMVTMVMVTLVIGDMFFIFKKGKFDVTKLN